MGGRRAASLTRLLLPPGSEPRPALKRRATWEGRVGGDSASRISSARRPGFRAVSPRSFLRQRYFGLGKSAPAPAPAPACPPRLILILGAFPAARFNPTFVPVNALVHWPPQCPGKRSPSPWLLLQVAAAVMGPLSWLRSSKQLPREAPSDTVSDQCALRFRYRRRRKEGGGKRSTKPSPGRKHGILFPLTTGVTPWSPAYGFSLQPLNNALSTCQLLQLDK